MGRFVAESHNQHSEHDLIIIYGKRASHLYIDGGIVAVLDEIDSLETEVVLRHFHTDAERQAYIQGIEDSNGWEDYTTINFADYQKFNSAMERASSAKNMK